MLFDKQFPYKTFEFRYYIYIAGASILTCFLLGSNRLTQWISGGVNTMAKRMLDETDPVGEVMKTIAMVILVVVMALVPYINSLR